MILNLGIILWLVSVIWFIYLSLRRNESNLMKAVWSILSLLFQPIAGIAFFILKKDGLIPMLLSIIAVILFGVGGSVAVVEFIQQVK